MSTSSTDPNTGAGRLGLFDAVSIIVGIVIGTSIYMVPWLIFNNTYNPFWGLFVWVLGGIIALIGAFCYAELASTYPKAGGDYFFLSKGFGPATGFLFGWAQLTVVMPASIGAMAYVFADFYQQAFVPADQPLNLELPIGDKTYVFDPYFAISALVTLVLTITNCLGVLFGKTLQNLLAVLKIVGLIGIIVAGFGWGTENAWSFTGGPAGGGISSPFLGSLAIILVLYAYGGWNDSAFVAAEVRDPQRNIPRALFIGVGLIVVVYLLVNAAYINGLGWANVSEYNSKPVPTRILERTPLGEKGGLAMSIIVMISALGAVNGLIFTGARIYATLGADHKLFGWMGQWRPGRGAPVMALLLQGLVTILIVAAITTKEGRDMINQGLGYVNQGLESASKQVQRIDENREIPPITFEQEWRSGDGFETLVQRTAPVFWFFFMLAGFSLFLLRERYKDKPRAYSVPFYPLMPLLFCNACAWMLYQATTFVGWHALFAVVIVLLGLPLYWLSRAMFGVREDPDNEVTTQPQAYSPKPPQRQGWR